MNKLKHHFLGGLVFLGTITFGYIGYSAYTSLSIQNDGAVITKDIWNNVINTINDIGNRTDGIYNSGGNIGIGISNPTSQLEIISTRPSFTLGDSDGKKYELISNGNTFAIDEKGVINRFFINSNGNVGIGTSSPSAKLEVNGDLKISGTLTNPQQPSFNSYNPSVTIQGNTVIFTATRHNTGNYYNTVDGIFTAPVSGLYHFDVSLLMKACTGGANYIRILWKINGIKSTSYGDSLTNSVSGLYDSVNMGINIKLNVGDTISVHNDGPVETYGPQYGQFSGYLIY